MQWLITVSGLVFLREWKSVMLNFRFAFTDVPEITIDRLDKLLISHQTLTRGIGRASEISMKTVEWHMTEVIQNHSNMFLFTALLTSGAQFLMKCSTWTEIEKALRECEEESEKAETENNEIRQQLEIAEVRLSGIPELISSLVLQTNEKQSKIMQTIDLKQKTVRDQIQNQLQQIGKIFIFEFHSSLLTNVSMYFQAS